MMELKGMSKKDQSDVLVSLGLAKAGGGGVGSISAAMSGSVVGAGAGVANLSSNMREGGAKVNAALIGSMGKFFTAAKAATAAVPGIKK